MDYMVPASPGQEAYVFERGGSKVSKRLIVAWHVQISNVSNDYIARPITDGFLRDREVCFVQMPDGKLKSAEIVADSLVDAIRYYLKK